MKKTFEKKASFSFIFGTRPVFSGPDSIFRLDYKSGIGTEGFKVGITILILFIGFVSMIIGLFALLK